MATFAFWASLPFVLFAALYAVISRLTAQQQDWLISHARYRSR
jgi:hypothetical protein